MFKDVTGRSVLDEPHHDTDRAAYAIAREWFRFEPGYALGLATLKADRLFDPEHRLLYWSIFRPGVLVGRPAAWFAARRGAITGSRTPSASPSPGSRWSVSPRPWRAGAGRCWRWSRSSSRSSRRTRLSSPSPVTGCRSRCWRSRSWRSRSGEIVALVRARRWRDRYRASVHAAKALAPALVLRRRLARRLARVAGRRHRPARAPSLGGQRGRRSTDARRLLLWAPAPPLAAQSPLAGSPEGVRVRTDGDGRASAAAPAPGGRAAAGRALRAAFPAGSGVRRGAVHRSRARPPTCRPARPPRWTPT